MSSSSVLNDILAGSISGGLSILVCHPIDVLRTKLQTRTKVVSTVITISTLYRGFLGPFLAQGIYKAVIFSSNSWIKYNIFENNGSKLSVFVSGSLAGCINSFLVAPVEFCRTQAVISNTSTLFQLSRLKPIHLFRCLLPTMIRDGPGLGLYFLMFESLRGSNDNDNDNDNVRYPLITTVFAGSVSGIAFWTWALPVDTFKTRMESYWLSHPPDERLSSLSLAKLTLGELRRKGSVGEIWRELYQAWPYAYGRGIPAVVITLTTYDSCLKWLES